MDTEIKFRVGTEDKARFEAAARGERRSLSDWIRGVCLDASEPDAMSLENQKALLESSSQKTRHFDPPSLNQPTSVPPTAPPSSPLTREELQKKRDDFYRANMAKGKK